MHLSPEISTLLTAMTPIGELRAALPIALIGYKMNLVAAFCISVIGNLIPMFLLLIFWRYLAGSLMKVSFFKNFFEWLFKGTRDKFTGSYKKWGKLALVIFVAIPLPMTGAWSGTVAAWLFGFKYWESVILISLGVIISGIIVTLLTLGGKLIA